MIPMPLQTRKMPKLEKMDLIEQGFGQNMEAYKQLPHQQLLCQFHKYRQTNDEFMMFGEIQDILMYAKFHKTCWLLYTRDPSDSQFDPKEFSYILKIQDQYLTLWENNKLIAVIENIKQQESVTYNKMRVLITNGKLSQIPVFFCAEHIPKGCDYLATIPPIYNSQKRTWFMEDCYRIQRASKRNFLLGFEKKKVFKMGKLQTGAFIVDFESPCSFVIAFSIALATCQWKSKINQ